MSLKESIINSITDYEQRVMLKFACLWDWSVSVTHTNVVRAIGKRALAQSTMKEWMRKIKNGQTDVGEHRGGDHTTLAVKEDRIIRIKNAFDETRHWSLRALANRLDIPKSTVQRIVKQDLKMKKILAKWVPHELSEAQMEHRILACQANLEQYKKDKSLAIDETWVALYMEPDRNQTRAYLAADEPLPSTSRQPVHGNKRMLIMAMDWDGIAFWELMPENQTIDSNYYKQFLERHIPLWLGKKNFIKPVVLQDNAKPHKAQLVTKFLKSHDIRSWYQPPYSPDLMPLDFNCFSQLKRKLRGTHHKNWEDFQKALKLTVNEMNESGSVTGVQQMPKRWNSVINSEGAYF